jgi:hypothetical protein
MKRPIDPMTKRTERTSGMRAKSTGVASIHAMLTPQTVAEAHHHAIARCRDREIWCNPFKRMIVIDDGKSGLINRVIDKRSGWCDGFPLNTPALIGSRSVKYRFLRLRTEGGPLREVANSSQRIQMSNRLRRWV